ncbi:MAG: hypothetical protein ACM3XM_10095 [Mycobacterium leprae]
MPDTNIVSLFQTANNVKQVGFADFTTDLITRTADALVDSTVSQVRAFSELVKEVAGGLESFKRRNPVTTAQVDRYLIANFPTADGTDTVIKVDGTYDQALYDRIIEALPNLAPKEGSTPVLPVPTGDGDQLDEAMVTGIRLEVRNVLVQDVELAYENLENLIRIGYARIICQNAHIETGLKFNVSANANFTANSNTTSMTTSRVGGGIRLGRFSFGACRTNLTVETVDSRNYEAITMSSQIVGKVAVDFRTESFDLEKMKLTQSQTQTQPQ